jgi:hypothetical protein
MTGRLLTREAFFWPAVRPLRRADDNLVTDISHRFINGRNELFARDLLHDVHVLCSSRRDLSVAWQERVRPCRFKLWESGTPSRRFFSPDIGAWKKFPPTTCPGSSHVPKLAATGSTL